MYRPHRDDRFEYAADVVSHIEERQCRTCIFKSTDQIATDYDYPMCMEIAGDIILEKPVKEIDDLGDNGLICTKYKNGDPTPPQVEGQEELF